MIILPIGHERSFVSRLPWVTIAVAALCLLLQIRASWVEPSIMADAERLTQQALRIQAKLIELNARGGQLPTVPGLALPELELPPELEALGVGSPYQPAAEETDDERSTREAQIEALQTELEAVLAQRDAVVERLPAVQLGYRPSRGGVLPMITSAFAHGGWLHLLGNLLFLYLVGCNMEDRWGWQRYLAFYLAGAVLSAGAFRIWHPGSEQVLVGASGAIAAVMGAFAVCLGATRIRFFYAYWITFKPRWGTFFAPAWVALPLWFLEQAFMSWVEASRDMGVAYSAHVGGFVFGLATAFAMRVSGVDRVLADKAEFSDEEGAEWSADPVFAEAKGLALEGHRAPALTALEELLSRAPDHAEARELALRLALQLDDAARIQQHVAGTFTYWLRSGKLEVLVQRYRELREQRPDFDLGEGALRALVTATARDDADPRIAIDVAGQLITRHPGSAILPRAMWSAAEAQDRLQRSDLAQRTLENLAATFPMDPFGERARRRLVGESLRPPRSA